MKINLKNIKIEFSDEEINEYFKVIGIGDDIIHDKENVFEYCMNIEIADMFRDRILNKKSFIREEKINEILS